MKSLFLALTLTFACTAAFAMPAIPVLPHLTFPDASGGVVTQSCVSPLTEACTE